MKNWIITVSHEALADIDQASKYYDTQTVGLGNEFLSSIGEAIGRLTIAPDAHPFYFQHYRRIIVKRFQFKIFYMVVGEKVIVARVLHSSRDHRRELK